MPNKRDQLHSRFQKETSKNNNLKDEGDEPNGSQFVSVEVLKSPFTKSNEASISNRNRPFVQSNLKDTGDSTGASSHGSQDESRLHRKKTLYVEGRSRSVHHFRQVQVQQGAVPTDIPEPNSIIRSSGRCQSVWSFFSYAVTFWAPNIFLDRCLGKKDKESQEAWREKVALCLLSFWMCAFLGLFTFYYQPASCPASPNNLVRFTDLNQGLLKKPGHVLIFGKVYDLSKFLPQFHPQVSFNWNDVFLNVGSKDLGALFKRNTPKCDMIGINFSKRVCSSSYLNVNSSDFCHDWNKLSSSIQSLTLGSTFYEWDDVLKKGTNLMAFNGQVINLDALFNNQGSLFSADQMKRIKSLLNRDATISFTKDSHDFFLGGCLVELYGVGPIEIKSLQCIAANIILNIALIIILSVVLIRFTLAIFFSWFLSWQLGKIQQSRSIFGSTALHDKKVTAVTHPQSFNLFHTVDFQYAYNELYTLCLVTCYSEGKEGLKSTLDSLAMTDYNTNYKLIFVVADGVVKGSGNDKPTGDIVLSMIELDQSMHGEAANFDNSQDPSHPIINCLNSEPNIYQSIGQGSKQLNRARVYCGFYTCESNRVPIILVYKCGMPSETKSAKPGNRGKRDSQIVLMDFLSKIIFDDKLSPFQFDLFTKWTHIMTVQNGGVKRVTPDNFEIILMVDADTKVMPDSLTRMVSVMQRDPYVMGLCGETRIMNKNESWVTMIQVFEYYVSHHLAKAFESIFGGVTCLPGCFCMYRIKAPKPLDSTMRNMDIASAEATCQWVPILANPDIVRDYSQSTVDTLHKKNLLLLGEDRYLTTLMLTTFPKRKMMFVPKAICKTVVPDKFSVLLSQRRRWINSTIHNLMELVLVKELCGLFCFSMQFVVFLDLVGTAVLPAAICFTLVLIVVAIVGPVVPWIPLGLLAAILGLPAVLILFTNRRAEYLFYMACYLLALPIWNFVFPVYSFWHFDDFSWGQTRKVEGDKGDDHGKSDLGDGQLKDLHLKRWAEWEKIRRKALKIAGIEDPMGIVTQPFEYVPQDVKRKKGFLKAFLGIKSSSSTVSGSQVNSPKAQTLTVNLNSRPHTAVESTNLKPRTPTSARLQSRPGSAAVQNTSRSNLFNMFAPNSSQQQEEGEEEDVDSIQVQKRQ